MNRRTWLPRGAWSAVIVCALASLIFLGSPGCGCGDDFVPPDRGGSPRCCCTFEWVPPRDIQDTTVFVELENADASLEAAATPSTFVGVQPLELLTFQVCVSVDHLLGDAVTVVIRGQGGTVYGRAELIYDTRCRPVIEILTKGFELVSPNCGGGTPQCCCEFEWLPGPNATPSVEILLENVDASLNPTISPSTLNGVVPGEIETFTICIDADHTLLDGLDVVIVPNASLTAPQAAEIIAEVGRARIVYRLRCTPEIGDVPNTTPLDLTSTECGGDPLQCCCDFEWLPPSNAFGDVQLAAVNASSGLIVTITPTLIPSVEQQRIVPFTVCVNADHDLLAEFTLVATTVPGGVELGRMQYVYRERCEADVFDIPDFLGLNIASVSCGGETLQCCCTIQWTGPQEFTPPNIDVTLENVGATLAPASVTPNQLTNVVGGEPVTFDVCVNAGHQVDETMTLVLTDADTGAELSRVVLTYDPECVSNIGTPTGNVAGTYQLLFCDVLEPADLRR